MRSPNPEDLESIVLINFLQGKGTHKLAIKEEEDMEEFLQVFTRTERTKMESTSEFPDKEEFMLIIYRFKSGGNGIRSLYKEDGGLFVDQLYMGVYKIDKNDIEVLDILTEDAYKEDLSIELDDMLDALVKDSF